MAHRAAEREVVADLSRLAEEVVVVEQRAAVAGGAAAGRHVPFEVVAVAVDERLDEGVVRGLPGDRQRHGEQAQLVEVGESSRVPGVVLIVTFATLSGRPCVRSVKSVNLNVTKLRLLMTQEPSAVPIFCRVSVPLPVVAAALEAKSAELVSTRFESR